MAENVQLCFIISLFEDVIVNKAAHGFLCLVTGVFLRHPPPLVKIVLAVVFKNHGQPSSNVSVYRLALLAVFDTDRQAAPSMLAKRKQKKR